MAIRTLDDLDAEGARLGVRVDVNSPLAEGDGLADDARIRAHLETLSELTDAGARVALLAHQGRPGGDDFCCLEPHAERLGELLDVPVGYVDSTFSADARGRIDALEPGSLLVLENTRFYSEEYMEFEPARAAETYLVCRLAPALDAYVNDAFAAAHRSQPSLVGFTELLPSYAGRVMERELYVLGNIQDTERPRVYLLGGAKIADSLHVADSVLDRGLADAILTAGVVGNVFLFAAGADLGEASASVVHDKDSWDTVEWARSLLDRHGDKIHVPDDVAVDRDGERANVALSDLPAEEPALDVGSATIESYAAILEDAGTAICNGPTGVFEQEPFAQGTRELYAAASRAGFSIVGGGDTAAALRGLGVSGFDHVSTGGGAALALLTGERLPAVEALRDAG